jgi:23S rRNA pseudouridine2605 synthase
VLSTLRDPGGRKVIRHLLVGIPQRVFPVGRLDYDAQGLVLMTNDGELAYRILHPKFQVERTYQVKVRGIPQEKDLEPLRKGLKIRGESFAPAKVHLLKNTDLSAWLVATLFEGRNREIKRMFEFIGFPVQRLTRTRFGPLKLGTLRSGTWRPLKGEEKRALLTLR